MNHRPPTIIDPACLKAHPLPEHDGEAGKAGRGKLLLVAGSAGLPGAAILAARAALRVGCGTVRLAAPRSVALAIGVAVPELLVIPLPEAHDGTLAEAAAPAIEAQYRACDAAAIGPGLGSGEAVDRLAARIVLGCPLPAVVDASALLAWGDSGCQQAEAARVLTPHALEMARVTGLSAEEIAADREGVASRFAREWGSTLALKGARTLVADPRGDLWMNTAGTPGLGTAGSGDVLAGVVGGLLARGASPTVAALWGVHLHAVAGEIAGRSKGDDGMIASDVVECLPGAMRSLPTGDGPREP